MTNEWQCTNCTFANPGLKYVCEMCQASRGVLVIKTGSSNERQILNGAMLSNGTKPSGVSRVDSELDVRTRNNLALERFLATIDGQRKSTHQYYSGDNTSREHKDSKAACSLSDNYSCDLNGLGGGFSESTEGLRSAAEYRE